MLDEREPPVEVDLERLRRMYVAGMNASTRASTRRDAGHPRLAGELGHRLVQHLDVELEAEGGDVARLLGAEQVPRTADLEVAHRDLEPGAELRVVGECREPRARLRRQLPASG